MADIDNENHYHLDPFMARYGAIPGRCNAYCRPLGSGKLCKRYPRKGKLRCQRHGGSDRLGHSTKTTPETIARRRERDFPTDRIS